MRKYLLTIISLIILSCLPAAAQSIFVKVGGGLGSQWGAKGPVGAAKLGFGYEYEFSQTLAIAPSIGFAARGWKAEDMDTPDMLYDEQGNPMDHNGNIVDIAHQAQRYTQDAEGNNIDPMYSRMHRTFTTNYLQFNLPINYYIRTGERRYLTMTAGVWGALGIAGKRKAEGDGYAIGNNKVKHAEKFFSLDGANRFDCGLKAGFGYQFPSSLTLNVEGEFGLLKTNSLSDACDFKSPFPRIATDAEYFQANDPFAGRSGRSYAVMVTLSYKLNKIKWRGE